MIKHLPRSTFFSTKIKSCLLVGLLVFVYGLSWGQTTDDYRTRQSGNWNILTTWERFNGTTWETLSGIAPLTTPTSGDNVITIQNTHTVTVSASVTVDQVTVQPTGQITLNPNFILTINNGTGTDLIVGGTLLTNSTGSSAGLSRIGTIEFLGGSNYIHNVNGSAVPTATWAPTSTIRITGTGLNDPTNLAQTFGNFIWNAPGLGNNNVTFNPVGIVGSLEINNVGAGQIRLGSNFTIGGNLNLVSGQLAFQSGNNQNRTITINGNVTVSGGTLSLTRVNSFGRLQIIGNYTQTGGTVTESSSNIGLIIFQGGGPVQTFSKTGGTFSQTVNFEVTANSFLQFADANSTTSGSIGTFVTGAGSTMGIRSPDGISTTGGTSGHILNSGTRTFSTTGNYIYNGIVNQVVGTLFPTTLNSLTIANTGGAGSNTVTLNANRTITSNLSVLSGTFNLSTFTANRGAAGGTLTLAANTNLLVSGTSNFPANYDTRNIDCASTVNFNAAGIQTIGAVNYGNLTLSGSGVKTLQTGTTSICGNFTLSGTASTTAVIGLTIGGNTDIGTGTTFSAATFTHNVGGNWTRAGTFTPGTSTINFNGANPATIQSTTFNNLNFSGTGVKTALSNLTANANVLISNNFNAGNGLHSIAGNWTNNGTFTPGSSTVSFNGSVAQSISGTSPSPFQGLIINNPLSVAVSGPISAATTLTISNGDFNTNGNLTMEDESLITLTNTSADLNGTILGTGDYDVIYLGGSRPTGGELSGAGLRDVTLTSTASSILTATSNFTMKGLLNIPTGVTLNMGSFSIGPTLITTIGGGQLQTQSTTLEPLPQDVTWSFAVRYTRLTAGQTIVYGIYENLEILSTSGVNTMEPEGSGNFVIRNQLIVTAPSTVNASDSRVEFNGFFAQTIPGLAFKKLVLSGSGDKTLDAATTISNELVINPTAIAKLGNNNRNVEALILNGVSQAVGSYGSTASAATNRPVASFGSTGTGILFVTNVCQDGKWTGDVNSDWFNPANWCNGVPTTTTDVTIPATVNLPEINTADAVARNIRIETGASLSMTSASGLSIRGNWINNGTFTSGTGTVTFQGTAAQNTSGTSATNFRNLTISNSAGVTLGTATSIAGTLTLSSGVFVGGINLTMSSNSEILRNAGSLTGTLQGSNAFDVNYTGNLKTSGPELVNTGLRNLSINLTAGQILTLGPTPALPDGNLSLTSGQLNTVTNTIDRSTPGGTLTIGPGTTFISSGNGTAAFPTNYTTRTIDVSSTVEYVGTNQTVATNTYGNVLIGGASGIKTFAGATTITGNLSIAATTAANLGNANSTTNTLTLGGTGQPNGSYGSTVSAALYKNATYFGTTATGILNITTSTLVCVNGYWIGGTSTDWFNGLNWCNGIIPIASTDVLIPAVAPFKPEINAPGAVVRNLVIESGSSLSLSATQILTLNGNFTNNGTITPATSTVVFSGSTAQSISGSSSSAFQNLTLNNGAGLTISSPISIAGTLTLTAGTLASGTNLTMNANSVLIRSVGAMTGTIQGSNTYNLTYQGNNKTTGGEVSGSGLNNVTVTLTAGQTLTSGGSFTVGGVLTIPTNVTLNMASFQLSGSNLTTSGSGTLSTQSPSASPIPLSRSWSFLVLFNNLTGGQKVVSGVYQNLSVQNNSGTTTLGPELEGPIEIASGTLTKSGAGTLSAGTSLVIFSGPSSQNLPAITFNNLELKGGGDKFFTGSQNILGNLTIGGPAVARLGTGNRTTNTLTLGLDGQPSNSFGSTASSATFKIAPYFGGADTGILNVTTSTATCAAGTWEGTVSTDWFEPANWCNGILPDASINVVISAIAPNQPEINDDGATSRSLAIQTGASLEILGEFTLSVHGDWINQGTFTSGPTSTVDFTGTPAASISAGSFANVSFTGDGIKTMSATIIVSGNITPISTPVILSGANTLTLNSGKTMEITLDGSVTTGSGRVILLTSAIYVNESTSNPTLEIRQTLTGTKGWRMIGTPVATSYANLTTGFETQGFPGSSSPALQSNLLWWDETDKGTTLQGWRQPSNLSATAPAGRGHYFYVFNGAIKPSPATGNYSDVLPITMSVTGTEINLASGIFNFPVTFTARDTNLIAQADTLIEVNQADEGFNMLSNPTASVIDFHSASGWSKTNIDETIYVWDPATEEFLTWNGVVGTLGSGRIDPFQAFWIKANATSPVLQISNNNVKSLVATDFFGRKLEEKPLAINLNLNGEGMNAETFISFGMDGKEGADPKDAYQLESLAEDWLLLYTYGSSKTKSPLVINNLPELGIEEKVIPLHLAASKKGQPINGSYLIDWKIPAEWPTDVNVVLMDHINQKAIDMKKESMHSFSFKGPEIPNTGARKSVSEFTSPKAVIFQSPYESGEVNARTVSSDKPQRPFTIYIGAFPDDRIEYLPDFPKLFAPVPNPFSSQTKIRFYLPVAEKASVSIYNLLGQEVGNFPIQAYEAGIQELDWVPSSIDLPNGMYVIRLATTSGQFTQKLIKN